MTNLSPETKQALKRYRYRLIDLDTNEIKATFKSRDIAARHQKLYFNDGIVCKLIDINTNKG